MKRQVHATSKAVFVIVVALGLVLAPVALAPGVGAEGERTDCVSVYTDEPDVHIDPEGCIAGTPVPPGS